MGDPRAPYIAKTDKERLATGFWNRIESNQATDCNTDYIILKKTGGLKNIRIPLVCCKPHPIDKNRFGR